MKILLEKLQKLEQLEKIADIAEERYTEEPENAELENAFDEAYKAEFEAYINADGTLKNLYGTGSQNVRKSKKH